MHTRYNLIALCTSALWLGACDNRTTTAPTPKLRDLPMAEPAPKAGAVVSLPVPAAESVFLPANAKKVDPPQGRTNSAMSAAQESSAMPMPGQNNDHSAPVGTARRAIVP